MVYTRGRQNLSKIHCKTEAWATKVKSKKTSAATESDSDDSKSDSDIEDLVKQSVKEFCNVDVDDTSQSSCSESDDTFDTEEEETNDTSRQTFTVDKRPRSTTSPLDTFKEIESSVKLGDNEGKAGPDLQAAGKGEEPKTWTRRFSLSTELNPGIDTKDIYVNLDPCKNPVVQIENISEKKLLEKSVIVAGFEKKHLTPPYQESMNKLKKQRREERAKTTGKQWFDMPAQELTEEKKNDLMILQMRGILDPKRFYKANDIRALPKFYQMGRVVEGPADFYNSRIPKKQRKATLVDELLSDAEFRKYNKRKYMELVEQKATTSGAYRHMKRMKKKKR